jgi:Ni/Co efflux regulator RcnB
MHIRILVLIAFASFAIFVLSPPDVQASGKEKSVQSIGEKGKGGGGKVVPPGQVKRYTRGSKLPADLKFKNIDDLSKWKLKPLAKGEKYIRVDNEILRVADDTQTVIEAVGIVDDLLR